MKKDVIAAFDFDGTLSHHDTLLHFLKFFCGSIQVGIALIKALPTFLQTVLGLASRQQSKEALLTYTLKGQNKNLIEEKANIFIREILPSLLNPHMMEKFYWHKQQQHQCVLVSANIDVYLKPWGELMGFDEVLCSVLAIDSLGCLTGLLENPNCWGPEKAHRLFQWLEEKPRESYVLYAYGNSRGDKELLEAADHPYLLS